MVSCMMFRRTSMIRIATLLLANCVLATCVLAEESVPPDRRFLPPLPVGERPSDSPTPASSGHALPAPAAEDRSPPIGTVLESQQKQLRYERMRQQIEQLSQRLSGQLRRASSSPSTTASQLDEQAALAAPEPDQNEQSPDFAISQPVPLPAASPGTAPHVGPGDALGEASVIDVPVANSPADSALDPDLAEPSSKMELLPSVDRLGLASSLFATRQYRECLHVLRAIAADQPTGAAESSPYTASPDTSDEGLSALGRYHHDWASYLTAGCYRELGQTSQAQHAYRLLVAQSDSDWIAAQARWWLDEMQRIEQLRSQAADLRSGLKQWESDVNELRHQAGP